MSNTFQNKPKSKINFYNILIFVCIVFGAFLAISYFGYVRPHSQKEVNKNLDLGSAGVLALNNKDIDAYYEVNAKIMKKNSHDKSGLPVNYATGIQLVHANKSELPATHGKCSADSENGRTNCLLEMNKINIADAKSASEYLSKATVLLKDQKNKDSVVQDARWSVLDNIQNKNLTDALFNDNFGVDKVKFIESEVDNSFNSSADNIHILFAYIKYLNAEHSPKIDDLIVGWTDKSNHRYYESDELYIRLYAYYAEVGFEKNKIKMMASDKINKKRIRRGLKTIFEKYPTQQNILDYYDFAIVLDGLGDPEILKIANAAIANSHK